MDYGGISRVVLVCIVAINRFTPIGVDSQAATFLDFNLRDLE